mmetsp:Transcript_113773/g.179028  ORF Transcript_113773/g.179028 Transcript_113773/m.179028 type:complete len:157 (+) Transcript_113773:73-543(+)|eukprot:CAMPEP_0169117638 /NCGR_PEP_ID=MMETSP1015-20121227/30572_1 /TAXON_ID=342587 /ORGANISM="Karlodinium micrum, Strain CCMP2283" /LENGTH=156 /DNA_ID=CAMNT_0009180349 /DNA_START=42 /DNA_END=512 /DNA_ORIENTATION=-
MGCSSSKASPATPQAKFPTISDEARKLNDYAKVLVNSDPVDVKACLGGLSNESRGKLEEILRILAGSRNSKTLAEYVVDVGAASQQDLNSAMVGLSAETRNKIEIALNGLEAPEENGTTGAQDAPAEVSQQQLSEEGMRQEPEVVETPNGKSQCCC